MKIYMKINACKFSIFFLFLFFNHQLFAQGVFGGKVAVMDEASSVIWWNTNSQTCDGAGSGNLSTGNATSYNAFLGDRFYMGGNVLTYGFPPTNDGAFLQWRYYIVGGAAPAWSSALNLPYANNTVCGGGSNKKYEYLPVFGSNIVQCTAVGNYRLDVNLVGYQNSNNYSVYESGNYIPFSVSALSNPTSPSISCGASAGQIGLSWTRWNSRDVVIVRNTTGTFTGCEPVNGTTYNAGNTIGAGANQATVVYRGGATTFTDTDLSGGTTYYYKIYSENYSYYSSGTSTLNATTYGLWTGATSTDWHTTTNWSCNTIPTATTDVIIPSGAPRYPVISTANAVAKSISLNASGATLAMNTSTRLTLSGNLSLAAGSSFDAGDGTVVFNTAATITGTVTFFKVEIGGGGVTFNSNCTIGNGTNAASLTLNSGGFVSAACPIYATNSTLIYNTGGTFIRGNEWTENTLNLPFNVSVNTGTIVDMDVKKGPTGDNSHYEGEGREMRGDLDLYGTLTMGSNSGTMAEDLKVGGNVTIRSSGGLILGSQKPFEAKIADIQVGLNFLIEQGGFFDASRRAVIFNGTTTTQQTFTSGNAIENFGYIIVNKPYIGGVEGTVKMFSNAYIYGQNQGAILQLLNGSLDLNGKSMTLQVRDSINNVNQNILIDGSAGNLTRRVFNSSADTATFNITHYRTNPVPAHVDTVKRNSANLSLLSFDSKIIVTVGSATGNVGVDFGSAITTINGTLRINRRGFVDRNPPTYATNSLLQYNIGDDYNRNAEWNAASGPGYPYNVQTTLSGTRLIAGGASNTATALNMAGSLTIDANTTFDMTNVSTTNMTVPLTVGLDINIAGTLLASQAADGNIILGRNWSRTGDGVFTPYIRSVTFNTGADATLAAPGAGEIFYDLIINKPATGVMGTNYQGFRVTLNSPAQITNNISLTSGIFVTTSTNIITVNDGATATGGGVESFVSGPMRKTGIANFSFPVGKLTNVPASGPLTAAVQYHYRPIAIAGLGATSFTYTAEFQRDNPYTQGGISTDARAAGLQIISFCEYWDLTRTGGPATITVTPSWSTHSVWPSNCNTPNYVLNSAALKVVPFNGINPLPGASQWGDADFGQSGTGTGNQTYIQTISWNSALNYNKFVLGSIDWRQAPLPADIKQFIANGKDKKVELSWLVNNNQEVRHYVIERSRDGIHFDNLKQVMARSSESRAMYADIDATPFNGWGYYRLRITDLSGNVSYSATQKVWMGQVTTHIHLSPNPAKDRIWINLSEPEKISEISILNNLGQVLIKQNRLMTTNQLNIAGLQPGIYYVRIVGQNGITSEPFVKE
jgi:hypothetical protein